MPGYDLGVSWWLLPDRSQNGDGRHNDYLDRLSLWRAYAPDVFDHLKTVVTSGQRSVLALQNPDFLPGTVYFGEPVTSIGSFR